MATANLEGAVSTRGEAVANKEFHFRGSPALLRSAHVAGGLDVVTVANNHSGDYGAAALLDTIRFAHAAGIQTVGGGANAAAALRPVIVKVGGLRIGFVGLSDVNPYGFNATANSPGTAKGGARHRQVGRARGAPRSGRRGRAGSTGARELHPGPVGAPARARRSSARRRRAGRARSAPARVRRGQLTGPHSSVVAWTLGNFVFPSGSPNTERTGILAVLLDRYGVRGWRVEHAADPRLPSRSSTAELC